MTSEQVDSHPVIAPLLKQCGILPARVIEVLRADPDAGSRAVVSLWDSLTPASRSILGLEAISIAAGLTPPHLWGLYNKASVIQSQQSIGAMIAESLPSIMRVTIKDAKKAKGFASREHIFKAARVLPTPKGSVINIGVPSSQNELEAPEDAPGGLLEDPNDFYLKASRAMGVKALPAPTIEAEPEEEETEEE